ncbi:dsba oxidoreductase protein [Purpureocillium lilacinum]|uniref:Dsba oxidoreductase protein n=1 Tax=Purpureocillium lilacinum TaxID=33203 RepID=A0A179GAJ1_PURLI|nr:dsba oxidoreductase protein [Purpureocillium lilacinum]
MALPLRLRQPEKSLGIYARDVDLTAGAMYQSQVSFIMDTICPWTYIAKTKLDQALAQVRADPASAAAVTFSLRFRPFQLDPSFPDTVPDRAAWSLREKHMGNEDAQRAYQAHMRALAEPLGLPPLRFDGPTGNTLQAHRLIQLVQGGSDDSDDDDADAAGAVAEYGGPDAAARLVEGLYRRYFAEGAHPASEETLLAVLVKDVGLSEDLARRLVAGEQREEGLAEVKMRAREVARDVDAVPTVVIEGRRRDLTLTGAKEVADYVKALQTIIKESK